MALDGVDVEVVSTQPTLDHDLPDAYNAKK